MAKLRGKNNLPIYFGAKAEGLRLASDLQAKYDKYNTPQISDHWLS